MSYEEAAGFVEDAPALHLYIALFAFVFSRTYNGNRIKMYSYKIKFVPGWQNPVMRRS